MIRVARRFLFQAQGRKRLKYMNLDQISGVDKGKLSNGKTVVFGQCSFKL